MPRHKYTEKTKIITIIIIQTKHIELYMIKMVNRQFMHTMSYDSTQFSLRNKINIFYQKEIPPQKYS